MPPCVPLLFFFYCYGDHRDLHSFPTRRSSDLLPRWLWLPLLRLVVLPRRAPRVARKYASIRSEEHTSELQSRPHLVCRLLLEKKKKKNPEGHQWRNPGGMHIREYSRV